MLTLYILRHAEAAANQKDDKARKLTARGRAQADAVGHALKEGAMPPPVLAIHSHAMRVRETLTRVRQSLPALTAREVPDIYNAAAEELYNIIRLQGGEATPLMLVGHNPGVSVLAGMLCGAGEPEIFQRMLAGFSPATLATIECPVERWSELMPDVNTVTGFEYPPSG
jgi:phosphohistidine phosphatase